MKNKKLLGLLVLSAAMVFGVTACGTGSETGTSSQSSSTQATDSDEEDGPQIPEGIRDNVEITVTDMELSDTLDDCEFIFDGQKYILPFDYTQLNKDWDIYQRDYEENPTLLGYKSRDYTLKSSKFEDNHPNFHIETTFYNNNNDERPVYETKITGISESTNGAAEYPELILPKGITFGSTSKEIEMAYGTPYDFSEDVDKGTRYYEYQTLCSITKLCLEEDKVVSIYYDWRDPIDIQCSIDQPQGYTLENAVDSGKAVKNTETDESTDVWKTMTFTYNGQECTLPFNIKNIISDGWTLEEDSAETLVDGVAGNSRFYNIEFESDTYGSSSINNVGLKNYQDSKVDYEDTDVFLLSVSSVVYNDSESELIDIVLPGEITWGTSKETIFETYGQPMYIANKSDVLDNDYCVLQYQDGNGSFLNLSIYENEKGLRSFTYGIYPEQ